MTDQEILDEKVDEVLDEVSEEYLDSDNEDAVSRDEVEEVVELFLEHLNPNQEIVQPSLNKIANNRELDRSDIREGGGTSGDDDVLMLGQASDGTWGNFRVTVVDLWDSESDSVSQSGLISDGESTSQFVIWSSGTSDIPTLEEEETYLVESGVVNDNDGNTQLQMNKATEVSVSEEKVEPDSGEIEFEGAIVGTKGENGLIMRDEDGRPTTDNEERDEYDLRLQLALDDGETCYIAHFDEEMTTELTGVTLDEAQQIGMEAMDHSEVVRQMLPDLIGRYMRVEGVNREEYIFVEDYEWSEDVPDIEEMLIRARAI